MDYSEEKKQICKFAGVPPWHILVAAFLCAVGVFFLCMPYLLTFKIIMAVFMFGMGIFTLVRMLVFNIRLNKRISELLESADARILVNDFQKAGRAFRGTVILGDKFIIPKDSGNIVAYTDFDRIYYMTNTYRGRKMSSSVYIRNTGSGKKLVLCTIPQKIFNDAEMQGVISYMTSKNPKLTYGN